MKPKNLILLSVSGFIVSIDQAVKSYVLNALALGDSKNLLGSFLKLVHHKSNGPIFRFIQSIPADFQDIFLVAVPVVALVLLILIFLKIDDGGFVSSASLMLILSGALANLLDRLQHDFVIDCIVVADYWSFNLADVSILAGTLLMITNTLLQHQKKLRIEKK